MGLEIFTSSGTFNPATYGLQAGDFIQVLVVGAGAGGDWGRDSSNATYGGGLAGSIAVKTYKLPNTNTINVTVGTGGSGGTSASNHAKAGQSSSFGAVVSAPGGAATGNGLDSGAGGDGGYSPLLAQAFMQGGRASGTLGTDGGGDGGSNGGKGGKTYQRGAYGSVPFGGSPAYGGSYGDGSSYYGGGGGGNGYGAGGGAGGYPFASGGSGASGLVIVTW